MQPQLLVEFTAAGCPRPSHCYAVTIAVEYSGVLLVVVARRSADGSILGHPDVTKYRRIVGTPGDALSAAEQYLEKLHPDMSMSVRRPAERPRRPAPAAEPVSLHKAKSPVGR